MKYTGITYVRNYAVLIFLFLLILPVYGRDELKKLSDQLDYVIDHKEYYTIQKQQKIGALRKLRNEKGSSFAYAYEINRQLYNEYKKFKLDSAIFYAERNREIAALLNDPYLKYLSGIHLASAYSYSGKFLESRKILENIWTQELPRDLLADYYEVCSRFYEHYEAVSCQPGYMKLTELYRDSLLTVTDTSSFEFRITTAHKYIRRGHIDKAEKLLFDLLNTEKTDSPEYAVITHYLGVVYGIKKKPEQEKKYYILSAVADIKSAIKENASFQRLALICYDEGDIAKAYKYTQSAIEDAVFSGVPFRTAQMSEFYSIINASYQAQEAKTNSKLKNYLLLISILSLFLFLLIAYVYKQMKKLTRVKEELSDTNCRLVALNVELNGTNDLLHDRNARLRESDCIKEQYIAQFFHLCSTYIDKMDDYRKTLYKLGINRQYGEIMKKLKSDTMVSNELEELYAHFDTVFLSLYPTFVSEFNSLLVEEERIVLKTGNLLTKELRIYALLRLGITDSARIAGFLHCSISTVYNYRTKMRNKADANREEFEERVRKIGLINRKEEETLCADPNRSVL